MSTDIEFYQRLREYIPEEAAKLIAEQGSEGSRLEAKVDALDAKFDALIERLDREMATKADLEGLRASMFRWNLLFFVPLWVGTYATLVAIVLRGAP